MAENKEKLESYLKLLEDVSSFTILEIDKLSDKVGGELPEIGKGDFSTFSGEEKELANRLVIRLFNSRVVVYENYINRWDKGLFIPNEEELKSLKKYQDNFDRIILPTYDSLKAQFSSLHDEYEKEERISKEYKKTLDKLLKNDEPRQKAEELLKKYKDDPSLSDNNSNKDTENKFDKQITNLQNQIKDLENEQNQDSSLEKDHKYKKELERLKAELEGLKDKNKRKTSPTSPEKKNNSFPYDGLIIGGVVVIIVLLLCFFFFFHKRTNK